MLYLAALTVLQLTNQFFATIYLIGMAPFDWLYALIRSHS